MADRIDVEEARRKVTGGEALLVCAYEDESKCDRIKLEGAISLRDFRAFADSLPKDKEIIFYCA
jgi:rhodanese-related sulfurtransferase